MDTRPTGFLQVDVDGLWAMRACYGRPEEETFTDDPCWSEGIGRLASLFEEAGVPATFFLVGRDLRLPLKRAAARRLLRDGHELANHSYSHRIGLTALPMGRILAEIRRTDALLRRLGAEPVGFRSPGYDFDSRVFRAVRRVGYLYDASLLPTFWGPALRLADAWLARRLDPGRRQFGRFVYGRAPRQPYFPIRYRVRKPSNAPVRGDLLEIPVGVTPRLRLPLTAATLLSLPPERLRALLARLANEGRPVLLLLHAIDGTDCRQPIIFGNRRPSLGGFRLGGGEKEHRLRLIVEEFARHFRVERAADFARREREALPG